MGAIYSVLVGYTATSIFSAAYLARAIGIVFIPDFSLCGRQFIF